MSIEIILNSKELEWIDDVNNFFIFNNFKS